MDLPISSDLDDGFRLLMESVSDYGIFLLDRDGIILTWNEGARRIKGYEQHEIVGKHFSTFYTAEDLQDQKPQRELKIASEVGRYEEEGWRLRKDGTTFWANIVITALRNKDGSLRGFGKVTRDLTTRKLAEEKLKESEERFRSIVESVRDYAIIMLDPGGHINSWNEGARRLKGYELHEIAGRHFSTFYEPDEVATGKCEYELKEAALTGRFEDEGWRVRKDGTKFWANVIITALRDSSGKLRGFAKVTRDMTERKRNEDKLKMAYEGLEKRVAERTKELQSAIESRDEFLSIASHELRTPLTALKLQQQIFERQLRKDLTSEETLLRARQISDLTKRQVAQLARLVDDMLDVSRISTGRFNLELEEQDLGELTRSVFDLFTAQFEEAGVTAQIDIVAGLKVRCDSHRIEQVLSNLISNAIKYGNQAPVNLKVQRNLGSAEILIRDHGPGIKVADQARIFKRYERAISANEVSGLGLGLFIADQILTSHNGSIRVESDPPNGATFIISLPLLKTTE